MPTDSPNVDTGPSKNCQTRAKIKLVRAFFERVGRFPTAVYNVPSEEFFACAAPKTE